MKLWKACKTLRAHSYDPTNDQENEDLRQTLPEDSDETELFNKSLPQHLAQNPESAELVTFNL